MIYKYSTQLDKDKISELVNICFGNRDLFGVLDNLDNRYLLAFDNNKLIAMTGISESKELKGLEIDWTCVHPDYRGKGIITTLLKELVEGWHKDIYCSCWRMGNNNKINLHHAMQKLGFKETIREYRKYYSKVSKVCDRCVMKSKGVCICYEDLYLKEGDK